MTGMKTLEENIERLESAIKRAEEMSREANSAAKAARDAKRELEHYMNEITPYLKSVVDKEIADAVEKGLEEYASTLQKATKDGHDHVLHEFDKLKNIMVYGNENGKGPSIVEDWLRTLVKQELAFAMRQN
jgi:DNA-binding protein Fis